MDVRPEFRRSVVYGCVPEVKRDAVYGGTDTDILWGIVKVGKSARNDGPG